jgi:hypothetical protein
MSRLSKDRFRDRDRGREIKKELIAQFYSGTGRPGELEQP